MAKDLFSQHAARYAAFRPQYPRALYDFLLPLVAGRARAWDCATGNGQVASALANYFQHVDATDISQPQLAHAPAVPRVAFHLAAAEQTEFPDRVFDLVTVGQAVHWFQGDAFYREVKRVAKPGAVLAVWGYGLLQTDDAQLNQRLDGFYREVVGPYWEPERVLIDTHYRTLPFPFREVACPAFEMKFTWDFPRLTGYLSTWSAVRKYIALHASDPVVTWAAGMRERWGQGNRDISFPLFMRAGYLER
ncbi:MAG: class I SAM-dependent methyltransferase [Cyclobacteriaceae bacterium]|jgi:SAM-dependent methyltransferase|nr:class I SAM-dependent methyltransferase [Cyclobacteriaceae bacterium]